MKKIVPYIFILLPALFPLQAQDTKFTNDANLRNELPPIDNQVLNWLKGEWQGELGNDHDIVKTVIKYEYTLDRQFLSVLSNSSFRGHNYKMQGTITLREGSQEVVGFWSDNLRGLYKGKGAIDNNMLKMVWYNNKNTITRIIKKTGNNKFMLLEQKKDQNGNVEEHRGEFSRIRDLTSDQ